MPDYRSIARFRRRHLQARERMARKTRTKEGRAAYARRKAIVEPVFGQMTTLQGAPGTSSAAAEWSLLCACYNPAQALRDQQH